jgi:hypothetical protein
MTPVKKTFQVENRLARAMDAPGGITVADALARAAHNIELVRGECLAALDEKIAEIDAVVARERFTANDMTRVYVLANQILGEAGVFGLTELSEAGRSLCELTANWSEGGIPVEPMQVHVAAMKSLRHPDVAGAPAMRQALLGGLRAVTAKLSAQARAQAPAPEAANRSP